MKYEDELRSELQRAELRGSHLVTLAQNISYLQRFGIQNFEDEVALQKYLNQLIQGQFTQHLMKQFINISAVGPSSASSSSSSLRAETAVHAAAPSLSTGSPNGSVHGHQSIPQPLYSNATTTTATTTSTATQVPQRTVPMIPPQRHHLGQGIQGIPGRHALSMPNRSRSQSPKSAALPFAAPYTPATINGAVSVQPHLLNSRPFSSQKLQPKPGTNLANLPSFHSQSRRSNVIMASSDSLNGNAVSLQTVDRLQTNPMHSFPIKKSPRMSTNKMVGAVPVSPQEKIRQLEHEYHEKQIQEIAAERAKLEQERKELVHLKLMQQQQGLMADAPALATNNKGGDAASGDTLSSAEQ